MDSDLFAIKEDIHTIEEMEEEETMDDDYPLTRLERFFCNLI